MTVLSKEAEASVPPSGLNATLYTASVCPARGSPSRVRVLASQRMTVLSSEAEASVPPSGLNATLPHGVRVPAQELTQLRVGIQGREEAAACLEGVFCATGLEA